MKLARIILPLLIAVSVAGLTLFLLFTPLFINLQYSVFKVPGDPFGLTRSQQLTLALKVGQFVVGAADTPNFEDPSLKAVFSPPEIRHLADVRQLLVWLQSVVALSVLASLGLGLYLWRYHRSGAPLRTAVYRSSLILLALVGLAFIGVVLVWPLFFILFHVLLFPQGNWAFPAESLSIRLFPDQFWQNACVTYLGLNAFFGGIMWFYHRSHRHRVSPPLQ